MRVIAKVGVLAATAAAALAMTVPATAGADNSTNYTGVFAGKVSYDKCTPNPGKHVASGTWRVNVASNGDASARFVIEVDGARHVAFTAPMQADALQPGEVFADTVITGAGPLRVSLSGTTFQYRIAPYDYSAWGGPTCSAVTYWGTTS